MGITKQYLRWISAEKFGLIGSHCKAINLIHQWPEMLSYNRICAAAACDDIVFWDLKTCQMVDRIDTETEFNFDSSKSSPITCLTFNPKSVIICSGHNDGSIRLFDLERERKLKVMFSGHRGFVSCLAFDESGFRIASGGKDTEIVIWDVVNQSGQFRLKGHKGPVNQVQFMKDHPWILISASSDTFIKLWDLNTQHCFKTLVGHRTEIWDFVLLKNDTQIISGGSDSELKVWKITFADENAEEFQQKLVELNEKRLKRLEMLEENLESEFCDETDFVLVENFGTILRKSSQRLSNIFVDNSERLLVCHGKDNFVECFKLRNQEEIRMKIKKRIRKEKKRNLDENEPIETSNINDSTISDEIERLDIINATFKIRCLDLRMSKFDEFQEFKLAILLSNNSIEYHQAILKPNSFETKQLSIINEFGHRNDVRTISISSDSLSILTASSDSVKLWNKSSCRCINTINQNIEYPLCSLFVPGDNFVVLGSKTGKLQIISLTMAQIIKTIDASETNSPIWSISLLPDLTGIVSGSEDKCAKFWSFDLMADKNENGSRLLTMNHERTLTTEEGIICTKVSPNSKFVALSLLDSCVKIYFCDTFKFFLSLYGHKFPVICMDISSDNSLIVTGSSDKNIKIWGMDFGDCHRSLFAHDDNIMSLVFIPKTHQFFTASKDHKIKMWDADNYEKIQTIHGHHGEINSMAIAPNGKFLVSASHDKSIRLWTKTNEPLVLEEEKELEHEREFEKELENEGESHTVVAGESSANQETGMGQKKTSETIKSYERLIESIDIFSVEVEKSKQYQELCQYYEKKRKTDPTVTKPIREQVDPHILIYKTECPYRFMLEILTRIKSNELEETLLQLPFHYIQQLLAILSELLQRRWETELVCRCICFLIRTNFGQITSSASMASLMDKIRSQMHQAIKSLEELIGVNTAGLMYYEKIFECREDISIFAEVLHENKLKKNKKQKKQAISAPVLTWN